MKKGIYIKYILFINLFLFIFSSYALASSNIDEDDFIFNKSKNTITKYTGDSNYTSDIYIPKSIDGVSVYHIGSSAFSEIEANEIHIPKSIKSIGANAFNKAIINTFNMSISSSTSIDEAIFLNANINNLVISKDTKILPKSIFSGANINNLSIQDIQDIKISSPFSNANIQNIFIDENIDIINASLFKDTLNIEHIEVPSSIKTIKKGAFEGSNIGNIILNKNTSIEDKAFLDSNIKNVSIYEDTEDIQGFSGANIDSINIPNTVSKINENAFLGTTIKKIILPNSIKIIEKNAFSDATIEDIIMPNTSVDIGEGAFSDAKIGKMLFNSRVNIKGNIFNNVEIDTVQFSDNIKEIPSSIFFQKDEAGAVINNLFFSKDTKSIGEFAFYNIKINNMSIPDSVEEIGDSAFSYAEISSVINIPSSIEKINKHTFKNTIFNENVYIQSGIIEIGESAFKSSKFKKDKSINIPYSVEYVQKNAFESSNIEEILIEEGLLSIGNNAFSNTNIKNIALPDTLISLGDSVFSNTNITTLKIPKNIKTMIPYNTDKSLKIFGSLYGTNMLQELVIEQEKHTQNDVLANGYWGNSSSPKVFYKDEYISINHTLEPLNNSKKESRLTFTLNVNNSYSTGNINISIPKINEDIYMDITNKIWEKTYIVTPNIYVCEAISPSGIQIRHEVEVLDYNVSSEGKAKYKPTSKNKQKKYSDYIENLSTDPNITYEEDESDETYGIKDGISENLHNIEDKPIKNEYEVNNYNKNTVLKKGDYPNLHGGRIDGDVLLDKNGMVDTSKVIPIKKGHTFDTWIDEYGVRVSGLIEPSIFSKLTPRYIISDDTKKMENTLWIVFIVLLFISMKITSIKIDSDLFKKD